MNKLNKLFIGFAAMSLFAACSSDDLALDGGPVNGDNGTTGTDGEQVFIKVNIKAVNPSRAAEDHPTTTPDNDKNYEYGTHDEHAVSSARFFFFGEDGTFISEGSFAFGDNEGTDANIEYFGQNVLAVDKSSEKGNPRYVITVLNAPLFKHRGSIRETAEALDELYFNDIDNTRYFVMSTSSWYEGTTDNKNHDDQYYYATRLDDSNFHLSASEAQSDANKVDIYVERLAAKYEVNVDMTNMTSDQIKTYKDDKNVEHTIYRVSGTVGGDDNDDSVGGAAANDAMYVEFLGWDVNATAKQSYLSKQFKDGWNTAAPFTGWDKYATVDYRTFWAKSVVYGTTPGQDALDYQQGSFTLKKKFGASSKGVEYVAYSNENTNEPNIFQKLNVIEPTVVDVDSRYVTHIVLRARACNINGESLDLVKYQGINYLRPSFLAHLLNAIDLGTKKNLNFWVEDKMVEGKMTYKQIDETYLTIVAAGDGLGTVDAVADESKCSKIFKRETVEKKVLYWLKDETTGEPKLDDNGNKIPVVDEETGEQKFDIVKVDKYVEFADAATAKAAIDAALAAKQITKAVSYNGGEMVYFIPVKHNYEGITLKPDVEGYYGAVRNHWYKLEVNSVAKLGHGVFNPGNGTDDNPGEVLIPDGPEVPEYYVGARINVLSWKVVNQNVDL